jgi:lysophospholipase L1-like esterase
MRMRRSIFAAVVAALLAGVLGAAQPAQAAIVGAGPPPSSMAALGDSITRGFDACGYYVDCTYRSWSTGFESDLGSHFERIAAVRPAIIGHEHNDAKTGATSADLAGQVSTAVGQQVQYVAVLMGANDACTDSEATMTPVATYRARVDAALARIKSGLPGARVFLASIPNVYRLWQVEHTNWKALGVWAAAGICQSLLAHASSAAAADEARRQRVRARVVDFNTQLTQACAAYGSNCRFDGNAVFGYPFAASEVSEWDYFHPNVYGQRALADVSYRAGFAW